MVGAICKWEIITHPAVTIHCFGWGVFFRALFTWQENKSFLSLLADAGAFSQPLPPLSDFIQRCADLERRVQRLYLSLSLRFPAGSPAREFFEHLACQEESHAELLGLCRIVASRRGRREGLFEPFRQAVPHIEDHLREAEASLNRPAELAEFLRLVIEIEASQINGVFSGVVAASDSRLPTKFAAFRGAVRDHLAYIAERIPVLEPALAEACRALHESNRPRP